MLTTSSLIIIILNLSLAKYGGDYAIGAYGIINSLSNLFVMIVIGFNQGMQPIAGYNYGARQYPRVAQVYKKTVINATMVTSVGFILAMVFPRYIAVAFTNNVELINLSIVGLRITMFSFLVDGFQIITASFFQSIGKAKISILISLLRQVLLLIPALLILPRFFGLNGVWGAIPVADFTAATITFIVIKSQFHKIMKP